MGLLPDRVARIAKGKHPRASFYLALAYLLWSIVPHFHVLIHSHAAGAHTHAAFSAAQVRLANRVLDDLGPQGLGSAAAEIGREEARSGGGSDRAAAGGDRPGLLPGDAGLSASVGLGLHAHFWEDANLAGAASLPAFALVIAVAILSRSHRYLPPGLRPSGAAPARGPPALLPA